MMGWGEGQECTLQIMIETNENNGTLNIIISLKMKIN